MGQLFYSYVSLPEAKGSTHNWEYNLLRFVMSNQASPTRVVSQRWCCCEDTTERKLEKVVDINLPWTCCAPNR